MDRVIPVRMELIAGDVDGGQLCRGDFDPFLVVAGVQARVDLQAGAGRGRADQVDDHLQALKRPSAPVEADVAEHAMLDFVPLRRPGREMADADRDRELVAELLQFGLPQVGAAGVAAAAVSSDRQARRVGVALLAEVLPPRADRVDREGAGVVGDPDRHHPLVGFDVKHAVRDRVPQILVLEVVSSDLHRPAGRLVLPPDSLEIPHQLALFRVYGYHRLIRGERRARRLVEMPKLRVTVRMILTLPRLGVRVQPKPKPPQQLPGRPIGHLMPGRPKRTRDVLQALRAPPQRRARIPTRIRIHQRLQRSHQLRIRLRQPRPPRTWPTDTTRLEPCPLPQLRDPTLHSVLADPRRTHDSRDPARPTRPSLRRRPQPALTLVQLRPQPPITLSNLRWVQVHWRELRGCRDDAEG